MIDVSVVVAVYNGEKYLSTLIDSILASGLQNIEVILVNDGSKDASEALCISYVEKDARVKYYSKKNSGIADTRNFGLMYAKGKYVCFMDQDDYIENHGLQRLYEVCEKYSCDFCSANLFYWDGINKIEHIVIENEGLLSDIQRKDLCKYIIMCRIFN